MAAKFKYLDRRGNVELCFGGKDPIPVRVIKARNLATSKKAFKVQNIADAI